MSTFTRAGPRGSASALAGSRRDDRRPDGETSDPSDAGAEWGIYSLVALAFALVVASNLLSLGLDDLRTTLINANWEFSWSHDADSLLLAVGVYVSVRGARRSLAHRRWWLATAGILALFLLDEVSGLHGQIGNLEKLLYAPILIALVLCVWHLTRHTPERVLVTRALGTLVFAFAMHVAGLHLLRPIGYFNYVYQTAVGFKEGAELAGLILLVTALRRASRRPRCA